MTMMFIRITRRKDALEIVVRQIQKSKSKMNVGLMDAQMGSATHARHIVIISVLITTSIGIMHAM